jgi:molybdate transport system regulatory protein
MDKMILDGRIWIQTESGPFLGYGRVELLEKIGDLGSLRKAASEMKISYRQAWDFIDQMNKRCDKPLVEMGRGGKGGGGALLTEEGHRAIKLFRSVDSEFQKFVERMNKKINK